MEPSGCYFKFVEKEYIWGNCENLKMAAFTLDCLVEGSRAVIMLVSIARKQLFKGASCQCQAKV